MIVFDGYCSPQEYRELVNYDYGPKIIFSREETADNKIKEMIENSSGPKNIVVVSDDKEIRSLAKLYGAKLQNVEDFIRAKEKQRQPQRDSLKVELNFSQIHKINEELKKIWLK